MTSSLSVRMELDVQGFISRKFARLENVTTKSETRDIQNLVESSGKLVSVGLGQIVSTATNFHRKFMSRTRK